VTAAEVRPKLDLAMCGAHGQAITDLQRWQADQNGTLRELRNEVGAVRRQVGSTLVAVILLLCGVVVDLGVRLWLR